MATFAVLSMIVLATLWSGFGVYMLAQTTTKALNVAKDAIETPQHVEFYGNRRRYEMLRAINSLPCLYDAASNDIEPDSQDFTPTVDATALTVTACPHA